MISAWPRMTAVEAAFSTADAADAICPRVTPGFNLAGWISCTPKFTVATLHITNGDHAGDKLRSFVNGPVSLACDVLHEGPCPPVDGDAWHEVRARFLAGRGRAADEVKASLARADRTVVDACARGDAIVLWFEHDLFDQLALIRTLDLIGRSVVSGSSRTVPRASLICIERFPGIDRFIGLGQLSADQLATLPGTAVSVTLGHYKLAVDAWRAFRSPDPQDLVHVAHELSAAQLPASEGGPALPFLGDALLRLLAEYPSPAHGLSRTQELALQALLADPATGDALFVETQSHEPRPFMGDSPFFATVQGLASARVPLVTVEAGPNGGDIRGRRVAITAAGREVLAHKADHVRLNGIDVWRGGVHLTGSDDNQWRWDSERERLVS